MPYESNQWEHRLACKSGPILKGSKPSDIPVFRLTKFELAIDLKIEKVLDLKIQLELLAVADEVMKCGGEICGETAARSQM